MGIKFAHFVLDTRFGGGDLSPAVRTSLLPQPFQGINSFVSDALRHASNRPAMSVLAVPGVCKRSFVTLVALFATSCSGHDDDSSLTE